MTTPYEFVELDESGIVESRPFTDVKHTADDLRALRTMANWLAELIREPKPLPVSPRPLTIESHGPDRRYVRAVLNRPELLEADRDFAVVGFFGQRRPHADRMPIDTVDTQLQAEFPDHPEVIAYCSIQLQDGNYGNLVLLDQEDGREHWRESKRHQYAVSEVAPRFYSSVRLHNGVLHGGLQTGDIQLRRTKYFDYHEGLWCGRRELR